MAARTYWLRAHEAYLERGRFGSLDGLRAISIIAVIFHHTSSTSAGILSYGYHGVGLFFAISGFLITTLLLREHQARGRIDFRAFYVRRALRIFPLYYAVLGVYCLISWSIRDTPAGHDFFVRLPGFFTFTTNWAFVLAPSDTFVFYHAWSLATEEQFYLLWPPLLMMLLPYRFGLLAAGAAITALTIADVAVSSLTGGDSIARTVLTSLATPICAGALMAICLHSRTVFVRLAPVLSRPGAPLVASLSVVAVVHVDQYTLLSVAMALLVAAICIREDHCLKTPLTWTPAAFVGRISYGMYLLHPLVLVAVAGLTSSMYWFPLTMCATVVIAHVSYRYFESPILRAKDRFAPGRFEHSSPSAISTSA